MSLEAFEMYGQRIEERDKEIKSLKAKLKAAQDLIYLIDAMGPGMAWSTYQKNNYDNYMKLYKIAMAEEQK